MHLSMDLSVKLKKQDVKRYVNHAFRKEIDTKRKQENKTQLRHKNKQIDDSLTKFNIDYDLSSDGYGSTLEERLENRLKDYNSVTKKGKARKLRSDAIVARGLLLQPSSDTFEGKSLAEKRQIIDKFTKDAMPFLQEKLGGRENIVGISAHLDETNPHVHVAVCPLADGRLNQNVYFGGPLKLASLHRSFRKHMNEQGWNFEVENKNEDTKHYSDSDYKRNAEAIEEARLQYTAKKTQIQ